MIHLKNNIENTGTEMEVSDFVRIKVNEFTDRTAKNFEDDVSKAHSTGQPIIPVSISSYGGSIYSVMQMRDAIKKSELPVLTYTPDRAYSAGFALLAYGTKGYRFVGENAFTMDHQAKYGILGKDAEVRNKMEHFERMMENFYSVLAEACGKRSNFFKDRWENLNNLNDYLNAEETLEIGAADEIGKPVVKGEIDINWTLKR